MNAVRRRLLLGALVLSLPFRARAHALDTVSGAEAMQALRDSLEQGGETALARLGAKDGYFANPRVKIGLPRNFAKAERFLRSLGHGRQLDDLVLAMNRAAESAAPQARALVKQAVKELAVEDAKGVLAGGDDAATRFFRGKTEAELKAGLLPVIQGVSERSDLARAYRALSATLTRLAGLESELLTVEKYVSGKAADGIYTLIAEEERALRANPGKHAGSTLGRVFLQLR
ncbi:MAG: DUF4197 domain-containing protein [Pseudomonadota bacterium]